jgi:uncharacterized protein (TIGR02186 family)
MGANCNSFRRLAACFLTATAILAPALATSDAPSPQTGVSDVVTVTTKSQVDIGLMYQGDHIYFFGTVPTRSADVIVKLTSSENPSLSVNRKGKVALMWMNVKQFAVTGLPLLYKIHSTRPINEIVSPEVAAQLGIGYEVLKQQMQLKLVRGDPEPDDREVVFNGILRLKKEANLYNIDEKRIQVTGGKLFKHYFRFPSAAKEGKYRAESFIFVNGKLIGRGVDEVVVQKKGIEATLTNLAYHYPAAYGLLALVVALGMGLLVGFVFKKGGGH